MHVHPDYLFTKDVMNYFPLLYSEYLPLLDLYISSWNTSQVSPSRFHLSHLQADIGIS